MNGSQAINTNPAMLTLAAALAPYNIPIRTGRRLVREGKLPACKVGREYFVDPRDVAALFRPVAVVRSTSQRETPTERERRQLAEAGIVAPK